MSQADGFPPAAAGRSRRFAAPRTVMALMLREMATTYGQSPGGYLWAILEPAAGILLLTLIFSVGFRNPPLGTNFQIFYATGMLPFVLYTSVSGKLAISLLFSKPLLAYPTVTFVDALVARALINLMTQLLVAYLILTFILVVYETRTILDFPYIINGFAMASALAVGIGVMNCFLFSVFPVWQQIWTIFNRPLFIISGIFFIFDRMVHDFNIHMIIDIR